MARRQQNNPFVAGDKLDAADLNDTFASLKFGGDGSDGALTVSSGTTTIDLAGAALFIKQYSSISITGTGKVAFINPHANGTVIIFKSIGDVTLTSSQAPMIDCSGLGAAGGAGGTASSGNGSDGSNPNFVIDASNHYGIGGKTSDTGDGGVVYDAGSKNLYVVSSDSLFRKTMTISPGAGGGGGQGGTTTGGNGGAGGRGGGGFIIECAGALNFTTTSGISVNGLVGVTGTNGTGAGHGGGAGGGGAAGMALIVYNTLTAASGTITSAGGTGGVGGNGSGGGGTTIANGGGGAGAYGGAGGSGGAGTNPGNPGNAAAGVGAGGGGGGGGSGAGGGAGGAAGGNQGSVIAKNYYFA